MRRYYLKIKNFRGEPHFKSKRIVLWLYNIPNTFSNRKLNQMGWKVQYFTTTLVTYTCIHKISWTPFPIRKNPRGSSIHRGHKISFNPSFNIMWSYTILKLLIIKKWKSDELGMGGIGRGCNILWPFDTLEPYSNKKWSPKGVQYKFSPYIPQIGCEHIYLNNEMISMLIFVEHMKVTGLQKKISAMIATFYFLTRINHGRKHFIAYIYIIFNR